LSIGHANICSSVQDHRQKFDIFIRFWKSKIEQKNQQKGSLKHLKYKCSWSDDVIRSKFVRSISSEVRSPEAEVHQEMKDLKLQRLGNGFNLVQHCRRLKECNNGLCERIWKHWMLVLSRALTKDNCTNCTTTSSTTLFVSLQQDKNNSSACRNVTSN